MRNFSNLREFQHFYIRRCIEGKVVKKKEKHRAPHTRGENTAPVAVLSRRKSIQHLWLRSSGTCSRLEVYEDLKSRSRTFQYANECRNHLRL
ncbi:hypothetical protein KM043_006794 [Ampulex compressa]|nr:hypothetical protein KM043_006794 [Ampulex compressa]